MPTPEPRPTTATTGDSTLLAQLRAASGRLGPSERRVARVVLSRPEDVVDWSTTELATVDELTARSGPALALLATPGTVIVGHGAFLRSGIAVLTGRPFPRIANGEVVVLVAAEGRVRAVGLSPERSAASR